MLYIEEERYYNTNFRGHISFDTLLSYLIDCKYDTWGLGKRYGNHTGHFEDLGTLCDHIITNYENFEDYADVSQKHPEQNVHIRNSHIDIFHNFCFDKAFRNDNDKISTCSLHGQDGAQPYRIWGGRHRSIIYAIRCLMGLDKPRNINVHFENSLYPFDDGYVPPSREVLIKQASDLHKATQHNKVGYSDLIFLAKATTEELLAFIRLAIYEYNCREKAKQTETEKAFSYQYSRPF